jgi:hypothetical protein
MKEEAMHVRIVTRVGALVPVAKKNANSVGPMVAIHGRVSKDRLDMERKSIRNEGE